MTLPDIIKSLEDADGPSREIDCKIADAFDIPEKWPRSSTWPPFVVGSKFERRIPPVIASVDAAIALFRKVLPGWIVEHIGNDAVGTEGAMAAIGWVVEIGNGGAMPEVQGEAKTLPIALCIAILKAKLAMEGNEID